MVQEQEQVRKCGADGIQHKQSEGAEYLDDGGEQARNRDQQFQARDDQAGPQCRDRLFRAKTPSMDVFALSNRTMPDQEIVC